MATSLQVQLRGGTTAEHANFTGADREVTVDTTRKDLVVHDGQTPGGFPLRERERKLVVFGDSISTAFHLQGPSWVDHLRDGLNNSPSPWRVFNLSATAMTFAKAQQAHSEFGGGKPIDAIKALSPDVVLVSLGVAGALLGSGGQTEAQRKSSADAFLNDLKNSLPGVKIIYAKPVTWDTTHNPSFTSWQNQYFAPVHWALGSTGVHAGLRSNEWATTNISAGDQGVYTAYKGVVDYVASRPSVDAVITLEWWRAVRLGCTLTDMIHLTLTGHRLIYASIMEQLRTSAARSLLGFTGSALTFTDPGLMSFKNLFENQAMLSSGGRWVQRLPYAGWGDDNMSDNGVYRTNPNAWYCTYKMHFYNNTADNRPAARTGYLIHDLTGAKPYAQVQLLSPTLTITNWYNIGKTDERGYYREVDLLDSGWPSGVIPCWFRVDNDVLPVQNLHG